MTDPGINTDMITSHLDIFPTVVDLVFGVQLPRCGLGPGSSHDTKLCTEGTSLVPLIRNPKQPVKVAAYSVYTRDVPSPGDAETDELRAYEEQLSYTDVATSLSRGGGRHGGGGSAPLSILTAAAPHNTHRRVQGVVVAQRGGRLRAR